VSTTTRLCIGRNRRGEPCQVRSLPDSDYCWFHDPDKAFERQEARSRGGRARHGRTLGESGHGGTVRLGSVADVVQLLEETVRDLFSLENSIARARAVGYLCGLAVRALEVSDLEARLTKLEAELLK